MRTFFAATLAVGLFGTLGYAQDAKEGAVAPPVPFADADKSTEAIEKGLGMLETAAKAYRTAPAITESIKIKVQTPMGPQNQGMASEWGPNGTFRISMEDNAMEIVSDGSMIFFATKDAPDQFIAAEIDPANPMAAFIEITGGGGLPDPVAGFRLGEAKSREELPELLSMGALQQVKVGGSRIADGVSQLLLTGNGGTNVISIDAKTSLISSSVIEFTPPGAPAEFKITVSIAFNPKVLEKLPSAIAFDPGDRKRVESVEELGPQPVAIGEKAPTFSLATHEGNNVNLEDLQGKIVVLDFWATWCGPCRKGLPELEKVAQWVAAEGLPVVIFGVDVWENGESDARKKAATDYWTAQKFSFPTVLDLDDSVVGKYGIGGIPATFIIGRDGTIIGYHGGFDPNMAETLKKELMDAVQDKG